jgi:chemotaxis protein MotB
MPSHRRKHAAEHENHERWLVSYADFMTLLFAFFVVMYAVSSINEGKYRVLSEFMIKAFHSAPKRSLQPIQVGRVARSSLEQNSIRPRPHIVTPDLRPLPLPLVAQVRRPMVELSAAANSAVLAEADTPPSGKGETVANEPPSPLDQVVERLRESLADLIHADLVKVRRSKLWVEVEIKSYLLFASGSAAVNAQAVEPLNQIGAILNDIPNRIQVEGFTDNVPINTPIYPSNWELSAARAANVVRLLMQTGVRPERMAAIGYGEYHPLYDNATEEGREHNRRVVLVILLDNTVVRQQLDVDEASSIVDDATEAKP